MATTSGSTFPIRPAGGYGSATSNFMTVLPMDPSVEVQNGDVIVIDTGTSDAQVNNAADGATPGQKIFGFAAIRDSAVITANATIDRDGSNIPDSDTVDCINVMMAMPGARFEGSLIATGPADVTGVYATHLRQDDTDAFDFLESSDEYACVATTSTDDTVYVYSFVSPQADTQGAVGSVGQMFFGREAGVGLTNPRVNFTVMIDKTVWGGTA